MKDLTKTEELKTRSKFFALRILRLYKNLPKTPEAQIIGKQLFRSASSVASNYRAVCRARSDAEFYSKICTVVEESDESVFWLEMLIDGKLIEEVKIKDLLNEANELLSIFAASKKTIKSRTK
jgi:four helix bundle protein